MYETKLKSKPHAQCHVVLEGEEITFVSYRTPVVVCRPCENDKSSYEICPIESGKYWDSEKIYTATTAQQISAFLNEYFLNVSYQLFKTAALHGRDCIGQRRS